MHRNPLPPNFPPPKTQSPKHRTDASPAQPRPDSPLPHTRPSSLSIGFPYILFHEDINNSRLQTHQLSQSQEPRASRNCIHLAVVVAALFQPASDHLQTPPLPQTLLRRHLTPLRRSFAPIGLCLVTRDLFVARDQRLSLSPTSHCPYSPIQSSDGSERENIGRLQRLQIEALLLPLDCVSNYIV